MVASQSGSARAFRVEELPREIASQAIEAGRAVRAHARERIEAVTKTRKSAETRERIIRAAQELMQETGGTDFQMKDVADRCKMSKGSVYYYFRDRTDLVQEIFDRTLASFSERLATCVEESETAADALEAASSAFFEEVSSGGPGFLAMALQVVQSTSVTLEDVEGRLEVVGVHVRRLVTRAVEEGLFRSDIDVDIAARSIFGMFFFAAMGAHGTGLAPEEASVYARKYVDLMMQGLGA